MVTDYFGSILQELGKLMNIELHPDQNNSCLIKMKNGIKVQIEIDSTSEHLIIGSDLGEVPVGRYRENLFIEALKINGMPAAKNGILAYSKKLNHLILFERLELPDLTGEKVAQILEPFLEKANVWREALIRSEIPIYEPPKVPTGNIFGVK